MEIEDWLVTVFTNLGEWIKKHANGIAVHICIFGALILFGLLSSVIATIFLSLAPVWIAIPLIGTFTALFGFAFLMWIFKG